MRRVCLCALVLALVATPAHANEHATTSSKELVALVTSALEAQAKGDTSAAREAYRKILAIDPDHALARRALGFVQVDGKWLTKADAKRAARPRSKSTAKTNLATLRRTLRFAPRPEDRAKAAAALAGENDVRSVRALRHAALLDRDAAVRKAAVAALAKRDKRSATHYFGGALNARDRDTRLHAAQALAQLGDNLAAAYVVKRWELAGGDAARSHFATMAQRSYIQDFDTEVAATSFIADPIVGVVQEGVVLDAKIISTRQTLTRVERTAYQGALEKISGRKLGKNVGPWARWIQGEADRLRAQRARKYAK